MNLKKYFMTVFLSYILYIPSLNAMDLHIGVNSIDVDNFGSGIEYSIGWGADSRNIKKDTNFYYGANFDFGIAQVDVEDLLNYTFDLKVGYLITKEFSIYAIGTGAIQDTNNYESYGFGYGAGLDYKISDSFALSSEYKTYTMTPNINGVAGADYDYKKVGINLKYLF